jgi:hypothetical protein
LTSFGTGTLRNTDLGLLIEDARTNVVLWNRDLTNVAWSKTNITAAKDQTGADGAATSASSLLATAANGTALQAITLASAAAFQSAYVKRLAGTGTVNMTMDNGATWTAITPTANWTLLSIPTQTLANPTVGFRIVTSGDQIAVDFVQNENGTFGSSPIPTTTTAATRAADFISYVGTLATILAAIPGSAFFQTQLLAGDVTQGAVLQGGGGTSFDYYASSDNKLHDPSGDSDLKTANTALRTNDKAAVSWSPSRSLVLNGGTVATASDTLHSIPLTLGANSSGGGQPFGYMMRVAVWNSKLADATLQALTAP